MGLPSKWWPGLQELIIPHSSLQDQCMSTSSSQLRAVCTGENQLPGLRFCHSLPPTCIQWLVTEGIHRPRAFVSLWVHSKDPSKPWASWDWLRLLMQFNFSTTLQMIFPKGSPIQSCTKSLHSESVSISDISLPLFLVLTALNISIKYYQFNKVLPV